MICPTCGNRRTYVERTYPDPVHPSLDRVRECRACGTLFATAEAFTRIVKTPEIAEIFSTLKTRISSLDADQRAELRNLIQG